MNGRGSGCATAALAPPLPSPLPATSPSPQAASQSLCHETTCGWSSRRLGRPRTWRTQARISAR
eukprot:CAMPEP_0202805340 /NCGR_PEP_ID=MMETSP1388-20130828/104087_1 /ASSEMBLY_ACC=CAM_ASM_000864 /TAXON_ID=37098 /ORGANISM="Isochrysis sp, Strain CCMP1244" /LENGTH=63 /DNA_ID=CAMNT_0049475327 /DNA_START=859 /DNA_END=1046 /DNA_ORIENTATION=+